MCLFNMIFLIPREIWYYSARVWEDFPTTVTAATVATTVSTRITGSATASKYDDLVSCVDVLQPFIHELKPIRTDPTDGLQPASKC